MSTYSPSGGSDSVQQPWNAGAGQPAPNGFPPPEGGPAQPPAGAPMPSPYEPPPSQAPTGDKMNPLAVASLIFGLTGCLSFGGLVFGISALRQIKQAGGRGRGLAITGIVLGAIVNGTAAILIVISFAVGGGS
jgi:Domain of unknown function (DUF4190)